MSEQFEVKIDIENEAFQGMRADIEVARILRHIANKLDNGVIPAKLHDINGNAVGTCKYIIKEDKS